MINKALKCFGIGTQLYHRLVDKTSEIVQDDMIFAEWTLFNKEYLQTMQNINSSVGMSIAFKMSTGLEDKLKEAKVMLSRESKQNIAGVIRNALNELAIHLKEEYGDEEFDLDENREKALKELIILYLLERI